MISEKLAGIDSFVNETDYKVSSIQKSLDQIMAMKAGGPTSGDLGDT